VHIIEINYNYSGVCTILQVLRAKNKKIAIRDTNIN
jgi:hypothetical protein